MALKGHTPALASLGAALLRFSRDFLDTAARK
jgi:hypothetical protein